MTINVEESANRLTDGAMRLLSHLHLADEAIIAACIRSSARLELLRVANEYVEDGVRRAGESLAKTQTRYNALANKLGMPRVEVTDCELFRCEGCGETFPRSALVHDPDHGGNMCDDCHHDSPGGMADKSGNAQERAWESREGR